MNPSPDPWQFFDKIYCISIESRQDRQREAKKQFQSVGLLNRVEFVLVQKHPHNPEKGIFESHMNCLKKGITAGAENILIFEDDICFHAFDPQRLLKATDFLSATPAWKAFFAGAMTGPVQKTTTAAVSKIDYHCLAHAYALNRPFAEQFILEPWRNIPFDNLLCAHCQDFFALTPMIAFQSKASTDNKMSAIHTIRHIFGGLSFIQRVNEFYQHHKKAVILSHLFFFAFFLYITCKLLQN